MFKRSPSKARAVVAALAMLAATVIFQGPCFSMVRVYHYTDEEGLEGIVKSGVLRVSQIKQGDANYGDYYLYVTELPPSTPFYKVLTNNYYADGGVTGRGKNMKDRADYVIAFDVDLHRSPDFLRLVNTTPGRLVGLLGDGQNVSLQRACLHGSAEDVKRLEEEEESFLKKLEGDTALRFAFHCGGYRAESSTWLYLEVNHMDEVDYQRAQDLGMMINQSFWTSGAVPMDFDNWEVAIDKTWAAAPRAGLFGSDRSGETSEKVLKIRWLFVQADGRVLDRSLDLRRPTLREKRQAWLELHGSLSSMLGTDRALVELDWIGKKCESSSEPCINGHHKADLPPPLPRPPPLFSV